MHMQSILLTSIQALDKCQWKWLRQHISIGESGMLTMYTTQKVLSSIRFRDVTQNM